MTRLAPPLLRFRQVAPPFPFMQRHHIIPRRLFVSGGLAPFLLDLRRVGVFRDDFARNGLFLPAREQGAMMTGLPLHRGPHRLYTEMVAARLAVIARADDRREVAAWRVRLLQAALARTLTERRLHRPLNRFDPMMRAMDFTAIDAMIDRVWTESGDG